MVDMYEDRYEELIQGLEQNFGYGEEILNWLDDKCLLSFIVIEGKDPDDHLVNYLD